MELIVVVFITSAFHLGTPIGDKVMEASMRQLEIDKNINNYLEKRLDKDVLRPLTTIADIIQNQRIAYEWRW